MGMIKIDIVGSFAPRGTESFSAIEGGHADAVAQAIEWLAGEVLPQAIIQDHKLAEKGEKPNYGFGKRSKS